MDTLLGNEIDWIIAIQSLGSWLELPMLFFTALGTEFICLYRHHGSPRE